MFGSTRSAASCATSARKACPIDIIYIADHFEEIEVDGKKKKKKVLDRYDIDVKRCMFCGLCEEACPTEPVSIWLTTKSYETAAYERNEQSVLRQGAPAELGGREAVSRRGASEQGADAQRPDRRRVRRTRGAEVMSWFVVHFAQIVFYFLAACTVAGAIGVIGFRNPVNAALSLLGTFLRWPGCSCSMHAEFLAAVQILVYAGGVMVLFLFVIMLVRVRTIPEEPQYLRSLAPAALGVGGLLAVLVGVGLWAAAQAPLANPAALRQVAGACRSATPRRWAGASTATTCCRSRSSPSCCWSR